MVNRMIKLYFFKKRYFSAFQIKAIPILSRIITKVTGQSSAAGCGCNWANIGSPALGPG